MMLFWYNCSIKNKVIEVFLMAKKQIKKQIKIDKKKVTREVKKLAKEDPEKLAEKFYELLLENENVKFLNAHLQEEVKLLNERLYGKKSEKGKALSNSEDDRPENTDDINEAETHQDKNEVEPINEKGEPVIKTTNIEKRKNLVNRTENLETIYETHDIDESEKVCHKCGSILSPIGSNITYTLRYIPAKVVRVEHKVLTYKCNHCSNTEEKSYIVKAKRSTAFPKLMVEDNLISHSITEKFVKHVPLYRQESFYNSYGLDITRANLSNWILAASDVLKPLFNLMHKDILEYDIVHMDETTLNVINKGPSTSYVWVLCSPKASDIQARLYFYKDDRRHKNAKDILGNFKGYVHSDGYGAYKKIEGTNNVGCMAHARRKFTDIIKFLGMDGLQSTPAWEAINEYIKKLYNIERSIKGKPYDEIKMVREQESLPILEEFKKWCEEKYSTDKTCGPSTRVGMAIKYFLNNYSRLTEYISDGRLEIDNNLAERCIKPFVIGRKNFLFCVSEGGAESSCIAYSIVESARANNLKVEDYLNYVFNEIGKFDEPLKDEDYRKLLPYSKNIPEFLKVNKN